MKQIALTQGKVALVDDDIFKELNQWKWHIRKHGKTFYARRSSPQINGNRCTIHMHHEIIGFSPKGFEVDHRNGQGLDNQRHNLRFVTHRQNTQNRKNERSSSQYPGVYWEKSRQKWMARIGINGKQKYLGRFIVEHEAFIAYKQAVENIGEKMIEGL